MDKNDLDGVQARVWDRTLAQVQTQLHTQSDNNFRIQIWHLVLNADHTTIWSNIRYVLRWVYDTS